MVFRFYFNFKSEFVAVVQHPQIFFWMPGTTEFLNQYWLILRNRTEVYLYSDELAQISFSNEKNEVPSPIPGRSCFLDIFMRYTEFYGFLEKKS